MASFLDSMAVNRTLLGWQRLGGVNSAFVVVTDIPFQTSFIVWFCFVIRSDNVLLFKLKKKFFQLLFVFNIILTNSVL